MEVGGDGGPAQPAGENIFPECPRRTRPTAFPDRLSPGPDEDRVRSIALIADPGFARERLARALEALDEADLRRLRMIAQFRARTLPGIEWSDLLNEAVTRALEGTRRWRDEVGLVIFLAGVMRSLADEHWRQYRERGTVLAADLVGALGEGEEDPIASAADDAPDPERELHARRCLSAIDSLFGKDEDALRVIAGLREGLEAAEIQRKYGIDATRYATTRRRIRRTLLRIYAERDRP